MSDHSEKQQPLNQFLNVGFPASESIDLYGEAELLEEIPCNVLDKGKISKPFEHSWAWYLNWH